jgi:formyltetrahydrofolate deformylase
MKGLILKVDGPDEHGTVAKIVSYVANCSGNLLEFSQFTDAPNNKFFARVEIDTGKLTVNTQEFADGFKTLGESLNATWHLREQPYKMRTAVLVTKTDHCINEIIWRTKLGEMPIEITSIIGNRNVCKSIAEKEGIPFHHIEMDGDKKEAGFQQIRELLIEQKVELTVLSRFMQVLPNWFCKEFSGKIINIHHSFLPAFIGANPYRQAYERGVKFIGATCHYVTMSLLISMQVQLSSKK